MPLSKDALSRALKQIKQEERYKQFPYKDTKGIETIGYGLNLQARGLSEQESSFALYNDIFHHYDILDKQLNFFSNLDDTRKVALIDMAYNMGDQGLYGFKKMLHALSMGDFKGAAVEMRNSKWYIDVKSNRADRLIDMIETGNWPNDIV
jgi:lysozyme